MKRIQPHIMCGGGDVANYVLLSGDPGRVKRISSFFHDARKVSEHRGFVTYTGKIGNLDISASSTGIGCPSAAIVVEELSRIGSRTFIRVGTTGAILPEIEIGDLIIATAAVRMDGTTENYAPKGYPASADLDVTTALLQASQRTGRKVHCGVVLTSDAFYKGGEEAVRRFGNMNVLSVEMECSAVFTLSRLKNLKAGSILAVDGNLARGTGKEEFELGEKKGEYDERVQNSIKDEIEIAIKAVKILEEKFHTTPS